MSASGANAMTAAHRSGRRAIAARACGLLPKNGALPDLLRTLRSARRGGFVVDPHLFQSLLEKPEDPLPALQEIADLHRGETVPLH